MDSVINKLRNTVTTVTSTVQQLSVVLPGNPVTREYEIENHIASAGPGLLWKVYSGYKKSTKQEAAIFVFEKRLLDKWSRRNRDAMIEVLKRGVQQLTKLKHPKVLTVQHPLEESRDSLAFASEPVYLSLANILGSHENGPTSLQESTKRHKLHDIEIKHGLLQLCEGLKFLHNDAKMLHGNICLESVVINQQGSWKIFGLDFAYLNASGPGEAVPNWVCREYDPESHPSSQPDLDFLAPEYAEMKCCPASDMFSLGMLMYAVYNEGKALKATGGNWHSFKHNLSFYKSLTESSLFCIPDEIRYFERKLLDALPHNRPEAHEFLKVEYFRDEGVKTLEYLDSLFQWDNLQKSKFYKGLPEILPNLPHRVRVHRVVPCLSQEFVNPTMVPFVLPSVLKIAEWSTNEEYVKHVLPHLRIVMKLREPVQILLIFMKYMELLLQKTPADVTKSDVLPLIYGSLESESVQVQELCLAIIPSFASLIDYSAMKNALFPRIRKLCLTTQSLSVRVNCLLCVGKILDHFDKWLVLDFVLPFLMEIPSREPAVIMGIVGIYKLTVSHPKLGVTKEIIATKIIPFVFPLCIENGLSVSQFNTIMNFVHELVKTVETEQRSKLEKVDAINEEQAKSNQDSLPVLKGSATFDSVFGIPSGVPSKPTPAPFAELQSQPLAPTVQTKKQSTTPEPKRAVYTPKDLTSSLISSNLNQMSKSSSLQAMSGLSKPNTNMGQQMTFNAMPSMGSGSNMPMYNAPLRPAFGNPAASFVPPQMSAPQQYSTSFMQQQPMGNFSMAPMMGSLSLSNGQKEDQSSKKLSKSEIDDFLS